MADHIGRKHSIGGLTAAAVLAAGVLAMAPGRRLFVVHGSAALT